MKLTSKLLFAALALSAAGAQASTLTFDSLGGWNGPFTAYTESGYTLTLFTPDITGFEVHIGDAGDYGTFNWHDQGNNGVGAYVVLTKTGGGLFNLTSLDYASLYGYGSGLTITAGATSYTFNSDSTGSALLNFNGVSSVTFSSDNYNYNQIDNLNVTAVPEPESYAMMIGGLALLGAAARRRAKRA